MTLKQSQVANFIIGGTEKAGTTSVFMYLGEHPQVCGSSNKETDFFRQESSGDRRQDTLRYAKYFTRCRSTAQVIMEASPGYLGEASSVAPRMADLIPDVKLLFILRNPIDRLYSSYNFHVGKLDIDSKIRIEDYVDKCLAYDHGEAVADELGLDEWYLKTLRFGCYADSLKPYFETFPRTNIKVIFFEQLKDDVSGFMKELSVFLKIDETFWDQHEFKKANVTFSSSNKLLHKVAIFLNNKTEPILRQRPKLKLTLVNLYKKMNLAREGYDSMPDAARKQLEDYYRPYNQALHELLGNELPETWSC